MYTVEDNKQTCHECAGTGAGHLCKNCPGCDGTGSVGTATVIVCRHQAGIQFIADELMGFVAYEDARGTLHPSAREGAKLVVVLRDYSNPEYPDGYSGKSIPVITGEATAEDVVGAIVYGMLPLHLAAKAKLVYAIEPPRGVEYTADNMRAAGAKLTPYLVVLAKEHKENP